MLKQFEGNRLVACNQLASPEGSFVYIVTEPSEIPYKPVRGRGGMHGKGFRQSFLHLISIIIVHVHTHTWTFKLRDCYTKTIVLYKVPGYDARSLCIK